VLSTFYTGGIKKDEAEQLIALILSLDTPASLYALSGEPAFRVRYNALFKFHIKGCLVEGVYVFRLFKGEKFNDYLYTPDAPDGIYLRPMSWFFDSIKSGGLGQYYYERVKYKEQPILGTFVNNVEFTNIDEKQPELEANSRVRSLRDSYSERLYRIISDVDEQTTSLNKIIGKVVYDTLVLAASAISLAIPPVGVALTVVQITKNVLEGVESYRYGDRQAAFNSFKDALVDLASLVPGGKEATKAQKTLIQLMGDGKTVVRLVSLATGQSLGHERLLKVVEDILKEEPAGDSKTVLI
jgi:hypothetical protein